MTGIGGETLGNSMVILGKKLLDKHNETYPTDNLARLCNPLLAVLDTSEEADMGADAQFLWFAIEQDGMNGMLHYYYLADASHIDAGRVLMVENLDNL